MTVACCVAVGGLVVLLCVGAGCGVRGEGGAWTTTTNKKMRRQEKDKTRMRAWTFLVKRYLSST